MRQLAFGVVVVALVAAGVRAQSLGEAAQKEKQKRASQKAEGSASEARSGPKGPEKKVYTAEDLDAYAASRPAESEAADSAPGDEPPPAAPPSSAKAPGPSGRSPLGLADDSEGRAIQERTWRARAETARAAVVLAEKELEAAQRQRNLLGPGPLPAGPGQDPGEWAKAANASDARLAQARSGVEKAKQNLEQLEEEARRAGIPPGWIR